jgi:D-proline reductase (dithiol) PrdB
VGLIARALEALGVPTLCLTSAWSITASVKPPRSVFLDFPLGHTAGRPDRPREQCEIMRDALRTFETIDEPGTIVPLPYAWGEDWKAAAGGPRGDQRTTRQATPQYQSEDDRAAAVGRFGESLACERCAAADVPTG